MKGSIEHTCQGTGCHKASRVLVSSGELRLGHTGSTGAALELVLCSLACYAYGSSFTFLLPLQLIVERSGAAIAC